jgi:hypothetical protein
VSWAASLNSTADPTNASGWEIHSFKKDTGNAARTITITGGRDVGERDRGASPSDRKHFHSQRLRGVRAFRFKTQASWAAQTQSSRSTTAFVDFGAETKVEVTIEQA